VLCCRYQGELTRNVLVTSGYALAALPIFQFLVYRWLRRTSIWYRFLGRVSKLDLHPIPTQHGQQMCVMTAC